MMSRLSVWLKHTDSEETEDEQELCNTSVSRTQLAAFTMQDDTAAVCGLRRRGAEGAHGRVHDQCSERTSSALTWAQSERHPLARPFRCLITDGLTPRPACRYLTIHQVSRTCTRVALSPAHAAMSCCRDDAALRKPADAARMQLSVSCGTTTLCLLWPSRDRIV